MMELNFVKMQGAGNDFILIDNRRGIIPTAAKAELAARLCPRAVAVGADGMIFLENDQECDARWDFYNSDGSLAEMCGNGARCFTLFARELGIFEEKFTFRTLAGIIDASVTGSARARVRLPDAPPLRIFNALYFAGVIQDVYSINTGVPHIVVPVDNVETIDVKKYGSAIRYHDEFAPAGTNVNFICAEAAGIKIRTYERGVEDETLACGTGSVAAAIVAGAEYGLKPPVTVLTRSGEVLKVEYTDEGAQNVGVYLEGPAIKVYSGSLQL